MEYNTFNHSLRTKKTSVNKHTISKSYLEEIRCIIFDDREQTIMCDFKRFPENKCAETLFFDDKDLYFELRFFIIYLFRSEGIYMNTYEYTDKIVLTF